MTQTSYSTVVILLINSMVGVGYLTLSSNFKNTGLIVGLASVFICGLGALYGSCLLAKAYTAHRVESYPDLVYAVLGFKAYSFITLVIVLYILFSTTMFIYFCEVLLSQVLHKYGFKVDEFLKFASKTVFYLIALILSLVRIQKITWVGYISSLFSFFTAIVLIIQTPQYFTRYNPEPLVYVKFDISFFPALGACFFAFTNHFGVISLIKALKSSNTTPYVSSVIRSTYFPFFLYLAVAAAGYISLGSSVPDLVIARKPLPGSNDILMSIGQLGLFIGLIVATSLRLLSNKDNVMSLFNPPYAPYTEKVSNLEPTKASGMTKKEILVTIMVGFIPYVSSLFIKDNVNNVISLISSILCPIFIVIMPALMNIKLKARFNYSSTKVFFIKLYIFVFVSLLSVSIGVNIYKFATGQSVVG